MEHSTHRRPQLSLLQTVRCLDCGEIYSKPAEGGTVSQNPGCPSCGYVGWLSVAVPAPSARPRRGTDANELQRHSAQSG